MAEGNAATGWRQRRAQRRERKKVKKIAMFGNARQAGKNMGREELKAGVEGTLRKHFPTKKVLAGGAYVEINLTHDLDELAEAKERTMREDPPEIVVLFGGDGTTQKTIGEDPEFLRYLTGDPDTAPEFIVVGGGTKNVVPTALKLLGDDPIRALDVICEKIERGIPRKVEPCPILKINDRHGFIYGSGLVVRALDEYYRHAPGRWRATKAGASIFWRETLGRFSPWRRPSIFKRFGATVSYRDEGGAEEAIGLPSFNGFVASSLHEVHSLLKVTHRAGERLSCFHAICNDNGFLHSVLNVPGLASVKWPITGSIAEVVTDRLVIRYQEPMRHTIDGEIYDSTAKLGRVAASEGGEDVVVIETGPYIKFIVS